MYKIVLALILTLKINSAPGYLNSNQIDPQLANLIALRKAINYDGYWSPPNDTPVIENDLPWCAFYGQYNCRPLWSNYYYPHGWLLYSPQNNDFSYGSYHQHEAPYPLHAGINSGLTAP